MNYPAIFYLPAQLKVPWYKKLNIVWWFGIADSPHPPELYLTHRPVWWRYYSWYSRNFLHNFFWYVLGVADRDRVVRISEVYRGLMSPTQGNKWFSVQVGWLRLPGWSRWWDFGNWELEVGLGWSDSGAFNLKCRRTIKRKNFDWETPQ